MKILVVEDEDSLREVMIRSLETQEGWTVKVLNETDQADITDVLL